MKLIQITDLHIGQLHENTHGVDVRQNFLNVLEKVKADAPDHLIISGDLCLDEPHQVIYQWIKKQLDELTIPYSLLVGNHDDALLMADIFDIRGLLLNEETLDYNIHHDHQSFIVLDTGKGRLSPQQLANLKKELALTNGPAIIFMHHPPFLGKVAVMDKKYALKDSTTLHTILFNHPHPITIFTGHYHVEKTIQQQNVTVHITPSTYVQIDQTESDFKVDHHRVAWRAIELEKGVIYSSVHYMDGVILKEK